MAAGCSLCRGSVCCVCVSSPELITTPGPETKEVPLRRRRREEDRTVFGELLSTAASLSFLASAELHFGVYLERKGSYGRKSVGGDGDMKHQV